MAEDVRALGGMYREDIERRFEDVWKEHNKLNANVCGNGRASLEQRVEDKIMDKVEKMFESERNQRKEANAAIAEDLSEDRQEAKEYRTDTKKTMDYILRALFIGFGAILTVQSLFAMGILHSAK